MDEQDLDLDNLDNLLEDFDGVTVEGGVDSENDDGCEGGVDSENDDGCEGGACKI